MNDIIFIRHSFKENETAIKDDIFNNKKIAFCNDWTKSWEEELKDEERKKYPPRTIFKSLEKHDNNVLVLAEYPYVDKLLIGKIQNGAKVQSPKYFGEEKEKYYKTLQLDKDSILEFDIKKLPVYLATRPIKSTCCSPRRPFLKDILPHIYKREKGIYSDILKIGCELLHPSAIEQMCEEYLRQYGYNNSELSKLCYSSCRVGSTMKDYDIVGRDKTGRKIFAQVKSDSKRDYIKILASFTKLKQENPDIETIFFCQENDNIRNSAEKSNVIYLSINKIFHTMKSNFIKDLIMMGIDEKFEEYFDFESK